MRIAQSAALLGATILAASLAACNKGPSITATNASQAEVQAKVADAAAKGEITIQPGRWEGTMTMHEMEMPQMANLPPAVREQMKARLGGARSFVSCVTPEDVKQQKAFYTGDKAEEAGCKYDHFSLSGGKIDSVLHCDRGERGKMTMTMTGTYSPDAYHMDAATQADGGGPAGGMNMKMTIEAKHVGACRGTKDEL